MNLTWLDNHNDIQRPHVKFTHFSNKIISQSHTKRLDLIKKENPISNVAYLIKALTVN